MNKYEDIINHERYEVKRSRMSLYNRACQFMPFSALKGYDDCINDANKSTVDKICLDNDEYEILNRHINILEEHIKDNWHILVTYFISDEAKQGGRYVSKGGFIKKIDKVKGIIYFNDDTKISIENIIKIDCDLFDI